MNNKHDQAINISYDSYTSSTTSSQFTIVTYLHDQIIF